MTIAEILNGLYGIKELQGSEKNSPEILSFFKAIEQEWVKTDETAWCAALANFVLKTGGFPYQKTLSAKSFLALGEEIYKPRPLGSSSEFVDIALFYRGYEWSDFDPYNYEPGHVAFYLSHRDGLIWVTGGNQSNMIRTSGYPEQDLEQYRRIYKTTI